VIVWRTYCAYRFPWGRHPQTTVPGNYSYEILPLSTETIQKYFSSDSRRAQFLRFVSLGFEGWLITSDSQWVTYGWVANCNRRMPPHIGRNLRTDADWIFYCGTKDSFRGQGGFKTILRHIVNTRATQTPFRELYVDAVKATTASRRGISSTGFESFGTVTTFSLRLPRISFTLGSRWDRHAQHPQLKT
jgi:hypothetical protein